MQHPAYSHLQGAHHHHLPQEPEARRGHAVTWRSHSRPKAGAELEPEPASAPHSAGGGSCLTLSLSSHLDLTSPVALTPPPHRGQGCGRMKPCRAGWAPSPVLKAWTSGTGRAFPRRQRAGPLETPGANGNQVPEVGAGSWGAAGEGWCAGSPTVLAPQTRNGGKQGCPGLRGTPAGTPQSHFCRLGPGMGLLRFYLE